MKTVLYIDDNDEILELVNLVLKGSEYHLITESNSSNAIKTCLEIKPELVLMDLNMPGTNGFDITRELRKKGYNHPIIVLTASESPADRNKATEAGCTDYILKTVDMQNVSQIIDQYIGEAGELNV